MYNRQYFKISFAAGYVDFISFLPLFFYHIYTIKRLNPSPGGGAIRIFVDWLIDWLGGQWSVINEAQLNNEVSFRWLWLWNIFIDDTVYSVDVNFKHY